jgi:hypothetical protein
MKFFSSRTLALWPLLSSVLSLALALLFGRLDPTIAALSLFAGYIMAAGLGSSTTMSRQVKSAILLDATYGSNEASWRKVGRTNSDIYMQSIYVPGTDTAAGSANLRHAINNDRVMKHAMKNTGTSTGHCAIPNKFYESTLSSALRVPRAERPAPVRPSQPAYVPSVVGGGILWPSEPTQPSRPAPAPLPQRLPTYGPAINDFADIPRNILELGLPAPMENQDIPLMR